MNGLVIVATLALLAIAVESRLAAHRETSDRDRMLQGNRTPKTKAKHNKTLDEVIDTCSECKVIVKTIEDAIKDKQKIEEIKNMLLMLCDTLGSKADECKQIVNNLDEIIEDFGPMLGNATKICQTLHLCSSTAKYAKVAKVLLMVLKNELRKLDKKTSSADYCEVCILAVDEVKTMLSSKDTQEEIKLAMHQVCQYLGQFSEQCDDLVDQYLPQIFAMVLDYLKDSKQLCGEFGLCQSETPFKIIRVPLILAEGGERKTVDPSVRLPQPFLKIERFQRMLRHLQTKEGFNVGCLLCKYGLKEITEKLNTDFFRKQIVEAAESVVCTKVMSYTSRHKCRTFMKIYLNTMVEMALHYLDNPKICKEIHACKKDHLSHILRADMTSSERQSSVCESCKAITEFVGNELSDTTMQNEIVELVKQYICTAMPKSYVDQCDEMVSNFLPGVMNAAATYLSDGEICTLVGICSKTTKTGESSEVIDKKSSEGEDDIF